jgi:chromosome transmission fidelity protein 4
MRRGARLTYRTIFTGGSDCLVRIHKVNEPDSEPGFHDNHEDAVTSLTCEVSREPKGVCLRRGTERRGILRQKKRRGRLREADKQGNTLITASLDNIARTFSYPQNEYTGYVTRSASVPIRWVSLDKKGERVAVCSEYVLFLPPPPSSECRSELRIYTCHEEY